MEKGTYAIDAAANPKQIDTTTDGREGIEKGIYALESDTLKLCLSTQGGARPKEFATRNGTDLILIVLRPGAAIRADRSPDLADQKARVVIAGTPEKQAAYYRKLLALAQERDFVFVISFIHQDYDALWKKIENVSPELFIAWRDCGLLDENGRPRPAYTVWKEYFRLPKKD